MSLYRFYNTTPGSIVFANTNNIADRVTFRNEIATVKNQAFPFDVIRTSVVAVTPRTLSKPNCTDGCADTAQSADSVRLEFSAASGNGAALLQKLDDLVAYIKANPALLNGFNPSMADQNIPPQA